MFFFNDSPSPFHINSAVSQSSLREISILMWIDGARFVCRDIWIVLLYTGYDKLRRLNGAARFALEIYRRAIKKIIVPV